MDFLSVVETMQTHQTWARPLGMTHTHRQISAGSLGNTSGRCRELPDSALAISSV